MSNQFLKVVAVLSVAVAPTVAEHGVARSRIGTMMLVESSLPSPGGHDTAVLAESESSGPTRGGRDTATA